MHEAMRLLLILVLHSVGKKTSFHHYRLVVLNNLISKVCFFQKQIFQRNVLVKNNKVPLLKGYHLSQEQNNCPFSNNY